MSRSRTQGYTAAGIGTCLNLPEFRAKSAARPVASHARDGSEDSNSGGYALDSHASLLVGEIARKALAAMASGVAYGAKVAVQPRECELLELLGSADTSVDLADERLNWKLSALVSVNDRYGAVKIVGSNAYNRVRHLPRSQSTILLFDKLTMQPLTIMDGTEISAARTGAYASIVADHFLPDYDTFSVFLIGAGRVAEKVVADLAAHHGDRIEMVYVKSRSPEGAENLTRAYHNLPFPVVAARDMDRLGACAYVITASNAAAPVFDANALAHDALVLHLGGDETPGAYIRRTLEQGTVFCDDVDAVCHRASQSVSLYFKSRGLKLSEQAPKYQIGNLWSLSRNPRVAFRKPALVTCVGLPVLDLYVAQHVFEGRQQQEVSTAGAA